MECTVATASFLAASVALGVAVLALRRRDVFGSGLVALAAVTVALWDAIVPLAGDDLDPTGLSDTLWLPVVAVAAQSFYVVARRGVALRWQPPPPLLAVFAAYPAVLVSFLWPRRHVTSFTDDGGFVAIWIIQAAYCTVLIGLAVLAMAERRQHHDATRRPLLVLMALMIGLLGVQMVQVPGVHLVATAALLLIYRLVVVVRYNDRVPAPAVSPLGALEVHAFAFDHRGRLVEATRSALRLVGAATGREPRTGDTVAEALGPDVDLGSPGGGGILVLGSGTRAVVAQARLASYRPPRSDGVPGTIVTLWYAEPATGRGTAARDAVTGALVRGALDVVLETFVRHADRTGEPLSIAVVDLDRFKQVNDEHGHATGDVLLAAVGSRLLDVVDSTGCVGRYGGDELVVVLPGHDLSAATTVARRLVDVVRQPVTVDRVRLEPSASVGVAQHVPGQGVTQLLQAADRAMYAVKRSGGGASGPARGDVRNVAGA
jgi:diguanylate cyclase (GGDEF)-like protein